MADPCRGGVPGFRPGTRPSEPHSRRRQGIGSARQVEATRTHRVQGGDGSGEVERKKEDGQEWGLNEKRQARQRASAGGQ